MRQLSTKEVQAIQLDILETVTEFCTKNQIHYWLDCGTLLGAVRHKGYIPWDDDIDIGMLRPDFDRFMQLFNKSNTRYQFICRELGNTCYYPYGKVLDTETILYEPDEDGLQLCVNIDVFVYDNAPDDIQAVKKMYDRRDRYSTLNALQNGVIRTHGFLKNTVKVLAEAALHCFPKGYFAQKIVDNSKRYVNQSTKCVGNFTATARTLCTKDVFSDFIEVEFESRKYSAPIGYDKWLTAFYGDYMQLPPKEKRVSHHTYKAYTKD